MDWKTIQVAPPPHNHLIASVHDTHMGDIIDYPVAALLLQMRRDIDGEHTHVVLGVMDPDTGLVFAVDQAPGVDSVIYISDAATDKEARS